MLGLLVLLVLIEQGVMTSGFFHSDGDSLGRRRRSMLEDDPCLDSRKVTLDVEAVQTILLCLQRILVLQLHFIAHSFGQIGEFVFKPTSDQNTLDL